MTRPRIESRSPGPLVNSCFRLGLVSSNMDHCWLFHAKFSLYIYIYYMIWFGLVLCCINHCTVFNSKSCLFTYIKYLPFGLVWFGLVSPHINHCCLVNAKFSQYVRGAFKKFPGFFVQAFKIVIDS